MLNDILGQFCAVFQAELIKHIRNVGLGLKHFLKELVQVLIYDKLKLNCINLNKNYYNPC